MSETEKSFMQKLWDRRFFQYLATYLGISWGLIQFTEWVASRYQLDGSLVDKLVLFLFIILPSIISLIYFHGKPGHDKWFKLEKILYPLNLVLALGATTFLFKGNAASSATTETVTITDEEGNDTKRIVLKSEYTSRIIFFPFKSDLNSQEKWKEIGIPILADADLEQDMRWYSIRPTSMIDELKEQNYSLNDEIPFSTMLSIANERYQDYFVTGELSNNGNSAKIQVHEVKTGKEVYSTDLSGTSMFSLVDQITQSIQENVDNRDIDLGSDAIDLPSSDLITNNEDVLKNVVNGLIISNTDAKRFRESLNLFASATQKDPNCAECFYLLAQSKLTAGIPSGEDTKKSVSLSANLPERQQMRYKYVNYLSNNQSDKAVKLLRSWIKLYPQDVTPYQDLVEILSRTYNFGGASEIANLAIENGHYGRMYLIAAEMSLLSEKLDDAENYINEFKSRYPDKAKNQPILGDLYMKKGDFEQALDIYTDISILNPNESGNFIKIADVYDKKGDQNKYDSTMLEALEVASTPVDSLTIYSTFITTATKYGRAEKCEKLIEEYKSIYLRNFPSSSFWASYFQFGAVFSEISDYEKLGQMLNEAESYVPEYQREMFHTLKDYLYAVWTEDKDKFYTSLEKAKPLLERTPGESTKLLPKLFDAYYNERWDDVLSLTDEFEKSTIAGSLNFSQFMVEAYLNNGKAQEGLDVFNSRLKIDPYHPKGLVSKAKLLQSLNKKDELMKVAPKIEQALQNAHPDFKDLVSWNKIKSEMNI